jgi:hypothetical protein
VSVVLHDLANTTQYLVALNTMLGDAGAAANLLGGLNETASEVDDLGFVLGIVAHGAGADVMHDRARRDGLDLLLAYVKRALRRERRDLVLDAATRSSVQIESVDRGRVVTWTAARFVFAAGMSLPREGVLGFSIEASSDKTRLVCRAARTETLERCARELALADDRFAFDFQGETSTLIFPPESLRAAASP